MTKPMKVTITPNGPYLVSGEVPLAVQTIGASHAGDSTEWVEGHHFPAKKEYALCRCGHSSNKPFCDGTHTNVHFQGAETASREPVMKQSQVLDGPAMQLADAEALCAFGRFCDPHGSVWREVEGTDQPTVRERFIRQVGNCPAGRLVAIDKATGAAIEPKLPPSIGVVEDPVKGCSGPLWVRGGIPLIGADGHAYEVRNRMTLCRCGKSENKPFCNGSHAADPKFHDGFAKSK